MYEKMYIITYIFKNFNAEIYAIYSEYLAVHARVDNFFLPLNTFEKRY